MIALAICGSNFCFAITSGDEGRVEEEEELILLKMFFSNIFGKQNPKSGIKRFLEYTDIGIMFTLFRYRYIIFMG